MSRQSPPFTLGALALLVSMDAPRADGALAACLAHETIGVAAFEMSTTIQRTSRVSDHGISLIATAQAGLRRLGAGVFTVRSQLSPAPGPAALTRPLDEAARGGATMLLVIGLDAKEFTLTSPYFNGAQYPLRTVKLQVTTWVADARSREVLTSLEWPVASYAKNSTDEAVTDLLSGDLSEKLAETMARACEGRAQPAAPRLVSALRAEDTAHAQAELMKAITNNVKAVCQSPSDQGKHWSVKAKGDGGVTISYLNTKGEAEFTKEEWEGVQQVLKEQQSDDNKNYRECARDLTPKFLEKFKGSERRAEDTAHAHAQALKEIADTADRLCGTVAPSGQVNNVKVVGDVKAELSGLVKKLANLGISGSGNFSSSTYEGVVQQELTTALKDVRECKLNVFKTLQEKLLR